MADRDSLLRALARISAIKKTLPDTPQVQERWVKEFHSALEQVSSEIDSDLSEFALDKSALFRSVAGKTYDGKVMYRDGLWCGNNVLMQKVEAVLTYLELLLQPPDKKIGFSQGNV